MPFGVASFGMFGPTGVRLNPDPNRADAVLLLPLTDGGGGSLDVTDYSPTPKTMTDGGAASWQTSVQKFYGGAASFPGSGSQQILAPVTTDLQLGAGSWSVMFFHRRITAAGSSGVLQFGDGADSYSMLVGYADAGNLLFYVSTSGSGWAASGSIGASDDTAFHHFALTYDGSNIRSYRDGSLVATVAFSGTVYQNANRVSVGHIQGGSKINAYVADIRIYKGVALSTGSTLTVPDSILAE
ncbi:LamG-like jellyroll fold domain-containing protein [Thalassobaculum sp.]|uniref:LamG-like jellyroll fold domain-containing protein n=1 Tax=Thalassobaculum sp. TaxID=2022740 RepID=UPI0032F03FEB